MKTELPAGPLHILTVVNLPWDPRLGAARVWIELAEEWRRAGHIVEKFCLTDAFPRPTSSRGFSAVRQAWFSRRAAAYVQRHSHRFDIIDCLIGTLPFSKSSLKFQGLLVARSIGSHRLYHQFHSFSRRRWPDQPRGRILGRFFHKWLGLYSNRLAEKSIRVCDLLNLPNESEREALNDMSASKPVIVQPYGLNELQRRALEEAAHSPDYRLKKKEICFIGMWSLRKGARDWPQIIGRIWEDVPDAQFTFLGTMFSQEQVFGELGLQKSAQLRCVPIYDPGELPALLSNGAVGLFPSYVEGFGLAVLEQLASGIPTVAYDVPGPRQILAPLRETLLTPAGDVATMARRALEILKMDRHNYAKLATECRTIANQYRWPAIASRTLQQYREEWQRLSRPALAPTAGGCQPKIFQIVPRVPGAKEGVGDYALMLSYGLESYCGYKTVFLTGDSTVSGEVANQSIFPLNAISARNWRQGPSIILHYVNYGYQARGVPLDLIKKVQQLQKSCGGRLITIFHELYASGSPWGSAFWLQPFQKQVARRIARMSNLCVVSSETMRDTLLELVPGKDVSVHPVFSTFGEPDLSENQMKHRDPHRWVIVGGTHLVERSVSSFVDVAGRLRGLLAPNELVVLGGEDNPRVREQLRKLAQISWEYYPAVDVSVASEILSSCVFGWIDYFRQRNAITAALLKSGSHAALCAHGVIPVLPYANSTIGIQGDTLPGPFFVNQTSTRLPSESERSEISREIYEWYHRYASSEHLIRGIAIALAVTGNGKA